MASIHEHYMTMAINEAKKGLGYVSPNPLVGAVIVKEGKIISTGYHKSYGCDHAEVHAVKNSGDADLHGATLYVTLEPCCHQGKTPPCTDLISNSGIKEVIISCVDPDTRMAGKGIGLLKSAGIKVTTGVLEKKYLKINSIYFHYKKYNRPYILMKAALTLDGRIATYTCDSKWISSERCRDVVQRLRVRFGSIAVGKNTVLRDKPSLNCRLSGFKDKPIDRLVFAEKEDTGLLNGFTNYAGRNFIIDRSISRSADEFIRFCMTNEIDSVLVEGGGAIYSWFLEKDLVDEIYLFYKPVFMGKDGVPVFCGEGKAFIRELNDFQITGLKKIDGNFLARLKKEDLCSRE